MTSSNTLERSSFLDKSNLGIERNINPTSWDRLRQTLESITFELESDDQTDGNGKPPKSSFKSSIEAIRAAVLICKTIPDQCPLETFVNIPTGLVWNELEFQHKPIWSRILLIPKMCTLNPLYPQLSELKMRAYEFLNSSELGTSQLAEVQINQVPGIAQLIPEKIQYLATIPGMLMFAVQLAHSGNPTQYLMERSESLDIKASSSSVT